MLRHYKEKRNPSGTMHHGATSRRERPWRAASLTERTRSAALWQHHPLTSLFNLETSAEPTTGGVGEAAKNGNVAWQRDAKARQWELRDAAGAADERGEIVRQASFSRR